MSSNTILAEQVREVAQLRAEKEQLAARIKDAREAFEATILDQTTRLKTVSEALSMAEAHAKALAVAIYSTTGETKPADGVTIKRMTRLEYDEAEALAWAKQTGMALIPETLDRKALEKIAKASPLPFVTVTEDPSATLASDLSAYVAGVA